MIKTTASMIVCAAALCFMAPAQGQSAVTADAAATSLCDKGDKEKGKKIEKPAESHTLVDMCDGEKCKGKDKDKDAKKPA